MNIRLTKIGIPENPAVVTGTWAEFVPGGDNPTSLPCGYWIEGQLLAPVTVGEPMRVRRTNRNGVIRDGLYESSCVRDVRGERVETANSVYRFEILS